MIRHTFWSNLLCFIFALSVSLQAQHDGLDARVTEANLVRVGQQAPEFSCTLTNGQTFDLSAQSGKVVLLYFFDKVPAACGTELKYLQSEISQPLANRQDFVILGIGRGLKREEVVKMGGESGVSFPLVADLKAEIFGKYFKGFVPRAVIISRSGAIMHVKSGFHEYDGIESLKSFLARQLEGK